MRTSSFLSHLHTEFGFLLLLTLEVNSSIQHSIQKLGTSSSFIIGEELTLICIPTFRKDLRLSCKFYVPPSSGLVIWGSWLQSPSYSTVHFWSEISGNGPVGDNPWEKHGHPAPEADQQVGGHTFRWGVGRRDVGQWLPAVGGNQLGLQASGRKRWEPSNLEEKLLNYYCESALWQYLSYRLRKARK